MRKHSITIYILAATLLGGCQKETTYKTAEDKLTDKVWYLEKKTVGQQQYVYNSVSTFSFRLTRVTRNYRDSDGIEGTYTISEQPSLMVLNVTSTNRQIDSYQVSLLEKDHSILAYTKNNILNTLYFSTRP